MKNKTQLLLTALWLSLWILGFLAFREMYLINIEVHVADQNIWDSRRFIAFLIFVFIYLTGMYLIFKNVVRKPEVMGSIKPPEWISPLRIIILIILVVSPGLIRWTLPLPEKVVIGYWIELFMIWCVALLGAWLLVGSNDLRLYLLSASALVLCAGAAHIFLYRLQFVTDYPFTLYWSEGNRFFDYSTLYGSFRYNWPHQQQIYAFITWGMQLPWAIPFLLPNLSIGAFRLWYQLMWILPSMALGAVCAYKIKTHENRALIILAAAVWAFTFLDQGPIYTPLVLAAILTVFAARSKVLPSVLLVVIASYYAHSSRWTWSYAPGLWAGLLALLAAQCPAFDKKGLQQLAKPICLGIAGYFGGQILRGWIQMVRAPSSSVTLLPDVAGSTTRQPLLWQRLLPNPTFAPGILLALIWAILPLVLLVIHIIRKRLWEINWLQQVGLLAVNLAFLVVGIIASTKIGGGSNLHNLDMFLVGLLLITMQAVTALSERDMNWLAKPTTAALVSLALVLPTTYALSGGERLQLPDATVTQEALDTVQAKVSQYSQKGEILFIDHRQLLTFGLVKNVPLIDAYEKKVLMDDAMTHDESHFEQFYEDLGSGRFALIVNEPTNIIFRGSEHLFGEENDAYVRWVTIPLLCTYEPIYTSRDVNLELLSPRAEMVDDPACADYGFFNP